MKVGLIGNPNVGKSTIFNVLTGLHQHTGNWPGKTVSRMTGYKKIKGKVYEFEDLPGTYSLMVHSKEEEVTRDFVFSYNYDALVVVCDAVCLERNLNLVLQVLEVTNKVVVVVNLINEAKKKGIDIDFEKLQKILNVPVIGLNALKKDGINDILFALEEVLEKDFPFYNVKYDDIIQEEIDNISYLVSDSFPINKRTVSLKLLTGNIKTNDKILKQKVLEARNRLYKKGIKQEDISVLVTENIIEECSKIALDVVTFKRKDYQKRDRVIDKIVTGKVTGILIMFLLLLCIFWLTIVGANYPSSILYNFFFSLEDKLVSFLYFFHIPDFIINPLIYGVYRVLAWVVSVMLPPMAIFFPLFTLFEDLGYLPRVAFNLDNVFKKCLSCGKQALTMTMNFGCNVVGVTNSRIIDSPRERLIAILTSSFIPCNGRFPILISIIIMFFIFGMNNALISASILTLLILLGIIMTFAISKLLSKTILKGVPSSFTLELPPYRRPQFGKVIIRSIMDRTIFVLRRAILVSAPAGLIIWLMANINIGDSNILRLCADFLDPFASLIGLDGIILMAFILGFPANEIVIPIMIMGYMSLGYITDFDNIYDLKKLFLDNNWTILTALCTMLFTLFHFPCLTTILTIKKETGSWKWTLYSIVIPALVGIFLCFISAHIYYSFL